MNSESSIKSSIIKLLDSYFKRHKDVRQITGLYHVVIDEVEKALILRTMEAAKWNKKNAALILGISRNTLSSKIEKLGICDKPKDV